MYWGGWLLFNYPNQYGFNDFLISNFAILFSLFGLGAAFQDISDRKETEKSASRIFYLLDRVSSIDPLSKEGKILDTSGDMPMKSQRKISIKRESSTKKMTKQQERKSSLEVVDEKASSNDVTEEVESSQDRKEEVEGNEATFENENPERPSLKKKKSSKKNKKMMKPNEDGVDVPSTSFD
jgi:hypothetical protein